MDIRKLNTPLPINLIDFRIQSVNKGGYATFLAYKNARADQQRLDEVVGPMNWSRSHSRDNHNCTVSIWNEATQQWVGKEDTGSESNTEAEKGLASDSFKRACFNWGIGRELYDMPTISIKLKSDEYAKHSFGNKEVYRASYKARLNEWRWVLSRDHDKRIVELSAYDYEGGKRYSYSDRAALVEWVNLMMGYARSEEYDALLTEYEEKQRESQDFVESAWSLISASSRTKIEQVIKQEREARKNG